ncbi:nSTAND1 domain-containing NTPase [Actinoallomurus acanthiterrae]
MCVEEVVARLAQRRFVTVFGASGVGKSSLLRAGLIPRMQDDRASAGDQSPLVVLLTPGVHPLDECAMHLAHLCSLAPGQVRDELATEVRGLNRIVRQALVDQPPEAELLVVMDQFEEVFTLCHDSADVRCSSPCYWRRGGARRHYVPPFK